MKPHISIVIPVYNEEDSIAILHEEIRNALDPIEKAYEIIFINDGSTDHSYECLVEIKTQEANEENALHCTRIIQFKKNFGQTAAMMAGFEQARGDIIISLDGDLQNDPADIPRLLDKISEGYDLVCGWRKERKDKAVTRILPSKVANWLIGKLTGVPTHDNGCSLKAYRRFVIKSVQLYSDMHRFIPAIASSLGANITELEVNHRSRKYGQTKYGLSRIWKVLFDMMTLKMIIHFHNTPLLWFGFFSFLFGGIGALTCGATILLFFSGEQTLVYFTITVLLLFLSGNFLSWGILAEFLTRVKKDI